jgi:acyl dehydratase
VTAFIAERNIREGDEMPSKVIDVERSMWVRYAGASGDFNPIHWDQEFARGAGYPDVFGMGMFAAGVLSGALSGWMGRASVRMFRVRFVGQSWPGEPLTFEGHVVRLYREEGQPQVWADCELTVKNARGETKLTGSATCAVIGEAPESGR